MFETFAIAYTKARTHTHTERHIDTKTPDTNAP